MKFLYSPITLALLLSHFTLSSQEIKILSDDGSYFDASNYSQLKNDPGMSPMACASASNLVTFYATNNAQRGHMFDISATNGVTILCFEMNFSVGTSNVDIYTKAGTHVGFENTAGAWTLVGSAAGVVSAGVNLPTSIPIAVNQNIAVGTSQAFYITRTTAAGPTVAYTNGTAVGNVLASDANIIIREGTGKELLFSTNYTPRQFNGRVFYNLLAVLPVELTDFNAIHNGKSVDISWATSMEKNSNYFSIEKSKDGINFEEVKKIKAAGNSATKINYNETDYNPYPGLSYYRIKQSDVDGKYSYTNLRSVSPKFNASADIIVNPMPAQNFLNLAFNSENRNNYNLEIFDITGKLVYSSSISVDSGYNQIAIDISILNKGMYFVKLSGDDNKLQVKFIKD